jgi:hypothetical protein
MAVEAHSLFGQGAIAMNELTVKRNDVFFFRTKGCFIALTSLNQRQ